MRFVNGTVQLVVPEGRDMSTVRHGVTLKRHCISSTVTEHDILSWQLSIRRSRRDANTIEKSLLENCRNIIASFAD